jgi:histidine triad (HIT) family protein
MTLFTKILNREIPAQILFEDDSCFAIRDINPQAPVHILLIPKKEIAAMTDVSASDQNLLGHLMLKASELAKSQGLSEKGYRLVINTGADAGQTVAHIHIHILGGRTFGWPAG